jgi:hypothetical protein
VRAHSRIIHCVATEKYRIQFWRWFWPFWLTEWTHGESSFPLEFNSEIEASAWLYERDLVKGQWRVIEGKQ